MPSRSRTSHFSDRRLIATAEIHFEHKSCTVKLHAYTLDSSGNLASALQQNKPCPERGGIIPFCSPSMIRAVRRPTNAASINPDSPVNKSNAETPTDCSHSCRSGARTSRGLGGPEAISHDRRADPDLPRDGAVLPSSTGFCGAAGGQSPRPPPLQPFGPRL